jgi:uncharacterized protein YdeI (YjbR/CyaY-like superfamily)
MEFFKDVQALAFPTINDWRVWLEQNGKTTKALFVILYNKNSGVQSITYSESVDHALCYGWIDSVAYKRDAISRYQYYCPRKPKSNWSRVNKEKVEVLTAAGLMRPPGQEMIDLARRTGTWDALNDVENLVIPKYMDKLLTQNPVAAQQWEGFSRSIKRGILEWIYNAKKEETKNDRIEKTVNLAAEGKKALGM